LEAAGRHMRFSGREHQARSFEAKGGEMDHAKEIREAVDSYRKALDHGWSKAAETELMDDLRRIAADLERWECVMDDTPPLYTFAVTIPHKGRRVRVMVEKEGA